jgi:hypothetical protein
VHHVLDGNLSTAESVVIVAAERGAADVGCLGVLNLVIGRLAARQVRTIVVSAASASLQAMDRGTYPNFPLALFVESEGDAAHLILHSARIPR